MSHYPSSSKQSSQTRNPAGQGQQQQYQHIHQAKNNFNNRNLKTIQVV